MLVPGLEPPSRRARAETGRGGFDSAGAEPWAHGVVGLGLAHGEWWLRRRTMSRKRAAAYLADFIWHAFDGTAREQGVELAELTRPRAVPDPSTPEEEAR